MKPQRRKKRKRLKPHILILCEGHTERNYFLGFKDEFHLVATYIEKAKRATPIEVVKEAISKQKEKINAENPFDQVWVLFDHDLRHKEVIKACKLAKENKIKVCFSSIAFEYWYLLHFQKTCRAFQKNSELIKELKKHYPDYTKSKGAEAKDFNRLYPYLKDAMANSAWLRKEVQRNHDSALIHKCKQNPWVEADVLIDTLKNLSKP